MGFNAWIGSENDSDSGTPVEGRVSGSSYHIQASYKFPTKKSDRSSNSLVKSVQQYISARALKFRSHITNTEDYDWIESMQAIGVVYGQRYFIRPDYQGLNLGWYLGLAYAKTDGFEWPTGSPQSFAPFQETLILPLNAVELNYHFEYKMLFVEPTVSLYVNGQNFNFEFFPSIIVGVQFN